MTKCSTVQVGSDCNTLSITKQNRNSIEITGRRPTSTVTIDKKVTNTILVDECCASSSGGIAQSYTHIQDSPALTWIVNHNLSYNPAVSVVSSSGDLVHGDVNYSGPQQVTINFSAPFSGRVYLS